MQKQEEGIVIALENNIAKVIVKRHSHCESCGSCPGNNAMVLEALNDIGAKVNQRVYYTIQQRSMLLAAFVVFILPLISSVLGYLVAEKLAINFQILTGWPGFAGATVGFLAGLVAVRYYDRAVRAKSMMPVITQIIDN